MVADGPTRKEALQKGGKAIDQVWSALKEVRDPEIPVLSLVDLNVIRDVVLDGDAVVVTMIPTFAGCPALEQMKNDVVEKLTASGFSNVRVETVLSAMWSTDRLSEDTKKKMRDFGLASPPPKRESLQATLRLPVECPFCGSQETDLESPFGPTLCKQIYYCRNCSQSFERFKPL